MAFYGSFNRAKNYIESKFLSEKTGEDCMKDEQKFARCAEEINFYLGKRDEYSVYDAYAYFHRRFGAYPIDMRRFYNYVDTNNACIFGEDFTISEDEDIQILSSAGGENFDYLKEGKFTDERNITLVIDPSFAKIKSPGMFTGGAGRCYAGNIILVIGTYDGLNINSMKVINFAGVEEIEYALEFFRLHCGNGGEILINYAGELKKNIEKLALECGIYADVAMPIENDEVCMLSVCGGEITFSLRMAIKNNAEVTIEGCGVESVFPLSPSGLQDVMGVCRQIFECGNVLIAYYGGREGERFEWTGAPLCGSEDIKNYYISRLSADGRCAVEGTYLLYKNFSGSASGEAVL